MSALSGSRAGSKRSVSRDARELAADAKVYKGALAVAIISGTSRGYYSQAKAALVATAVGRFRETVDNTGGADGDKVAQIDFFRERVLFLLDNDTGAALDKTDREQLCYALDDHTATSTVETCDAGVVYDVTDEGVWVEISDPQSAASAPGLSAVAPVDPSSTAASAGSASLASKQDHKHHIALATPAAEGLMSATQASAVHAAVANMTALKAIAAADRADGMICGVLSDTAAEFSLWKFSAASAAADTSENLVAVPAVGTGRWLRADKIVNLFLPATFATADNATLFTVPVGARLRPITAYWDINTSWAGGSSSTIGLHASPTGWATKGDILGGAAGDVAATLVSTNARKVGTAGAKAVLGDFGLILVAADTIKFDQITSTFTSGVGKARIPCELIVNPGA